MALLDEITKKATKELDKQIKGKKNKHKKHKDDQIKNLEKKAEKELKKRFKI